MLTLALPKGRLLDPAITLLAELGIRGIDPDSRRLLQADDAAGLRFILLKPADVPTYVEYGAADLGIVGKDILLEQQPDVYEPVDLGFGFCWLVVAETRELWERDDPAKWSWVRVATKYPRLTEYYFSERGIQVEMVRLDGSIELAPLVGLAERIEIAGVPELGGARHRVIPDRIEAGTLLVAAAITGGDVTVVGADPRHMSAMLSKLEECGAAVTVTDDRIRCQGPARPKAADIITSPFPGFPTDMQAQFMAMLGLADGISKITETIFENRFMHAAELSRMGARIEAEGSIAVVRGVRYYQGAPVMATDLRASASLVLAGLAARGGTEVSRVYHLDRGYERLEVKLRALGAIIDRVK